MKLPREEKVVETDEEWGDHTLLDNHHNCTNKNDNHITKSISFFHLSSWRCIQLGPGKEYHLPISQLQINLNVMIIKYW